MDILISIAAKVAEYTVAPIGQKVRYLIFYKSNFKELIDRVKELEGARDEVKHLVENERRNGKEIETSVKNWLDRVDGVIDEACLLQQDPRRAQARCSRWSFPNLIVRHQLSRKATKMVKDINVEVQGKGKFNQIGYPPPLDGVGSTSTTISNEKFESRKSIMKGIFQALRDPKVSKIGVYGLRGVGKTTLVKEVAQKAKQEKLFDVVVMANISQAPDLKRIQGEIADLLGLRFDEETVAGRAARLCRRIKMEKTILIILDDIWTRLDLEQARIPIGDEHYGCKVLMTSRNQDMLREMEVQKDFRLEVLNAGETWSLFNDMAGDVDKDPNLQQIASKVAQKCAGLPVLIVTVARALKNQDIHIWKDAFNQLARVDNRELLEITYSAVELSYNRLVSGEMKVLFLLCAVNEHPFINDLFKYGMGLGIFTGTNTLEEARNRLHKMINALKSSCLLLEDYSIRRQVKMHDTVRDVALSIASRDQHILIKKGAQLKEWPTKGILDRCPQIFLDIIDIPKLPERLDCPNLELFNLCRNDSLGIPDSFFEGMGNLKILDITRINLPSLPRSFHSLTNLKTLCLDICHLGNIDAIGALKNLEILSLSQFSIMKLPSEIGKLTCLRMLDLSDSGIKVIPPNIISNLIKLEELYMGNTSIKWGMEENASLTELRQLSNLTALELQICEAWMLPRDLMFEKLEKYNIFIGDVWLLSRHVNLKTLELKLGTSIHLEHGIKVLIRQVDNLYLDEVEGIDNVLYQLNGEGFPLLKRLYIQNNEKIKHIVDSTETNQAQISFPSLELLVLLDLSNLEKICSGLLAVNSFGKLKELYIHSCSRLIILLPSSISLKNLTDLRVGHCKGLTYLITSSTAKSLIQLEILEVRYCEMIEDVVKVDDEEAEEEILFQNLEHMNLTSLSSLRSFCHGKHVMRFPSLTTLKIKACHKMKTFASGDIISPFLTAVEVEDGSKCWKGDLNSTIEHLFTDKPKTSTLSAEDSSTYRIRHYCN